MRPGGALLLALGSLVATRAAAQKPVIAKDGIVNAASYASTRDMARPVSMGSIATIFGENLADRRLAAESYPLPRELGSTSVLVNGQPAPLFFVSPRQINFQVPWGPPLPIFYTIEVVVKTAAGSSEPYALPIRMPAPGIFTQDGSGCGQGAVLNVASDGTMSVNSPANSASPGGYIAVFALGAGSIHEPPPDGDPTPLDRLLGLEPTGPFGAAAFLGGKHTRAVFSGLAPGLVGVHQLNLELPRDAPEGCAIPLRLFSPSDGLASQDVGISVRRGGGQCIDPPPVPSSSAVLEWRRTQSSGLEPAPPPELFTASFVLVPDTRLLPLSPNRWGRRFIAHPVLPSPWTACECFDELQPFKSCPQFEDKRLDAGALTLAVPGGAPIQVQPSEVGGKLIYQAALPPGTIRGGAFTVSGSGGAGAGAFQTSTDISPPIHLLSNFAPGSSVPAYRPIEVRWNGGAPGDAVRLRLTQLSYYGRSFCECSVPATNGAVVIPLVDYGPSFVPVLPFWVHADVEIAVTQEPAAEGVARFSATGLFAGGQHRWLYQWRFGQLKLSP